MKKKMIAPICIGIVIAIYMLVWISAVLLLDMSSLAQWLLALPFIASLFLWIHVVMERVHEIRSGEEDDLSKY